MWSTAAETPVKVILLTFASEGQRVNGPKAAEWSALAEWGIVGLRVTQLVLERHIEAANRCYCLGRIYRALDSTGGSYREA